MPSVVGEITKGAEFTGLIRAADLIVSALTVSELLRVNAAGTALESSGSKAADFIPKSIVDAEGDLLVAEGTGLVGRFPIGTINQHLTSDGTTLLWQTPDFAASSHNHNASDINAGELALVRGGANADVSAFTVSELVRLNAGGTALESAGKTVADLHADIGCRAYHDADQAVATSTWTPLAFNQERWDTDTIHDLSTNNGRLTCKTAGVYTIWGGVMTDFVEAASQWMLRIVLNGSIFLARFSGSMNRHQMCLGTIYKLAVNDYVRLEMWQQSGVSKNARVVPNFSVEFAMQLIART